MERTQAELLPDSDKVFKTARNHFHHDVQRSKRQFWDGWLADIIHMRQLLQVSWCVTSAAADAAADAVAAVAAVALSAHVRWLRVPHIWCLCNSSRNFTRTRLSWMDSGCESTLASTKYLYVI